MTETPPPSPTPEVVNEALSFTSAVFEVVERVISFAIGAFLTVAAVVALAGAALMMWHGVTQRQGAGLVFGAVDQLLFVLMLVEILHTVRRSIEQNELACEPFLIVGLIATVRRILVVTLESSDTAANAKVGSTSFEHAMIELVVLGALILVLVGSIYILRHAERSPAAVRLRRRADTLGRGPADRPAP